jgi:hypothetical protein
MKVEQFMEWELAGETKVLRAVLIILGEEFELWRSSLCSLFQPPNISSLVGPHILFSTLFWYTLSLCSSLNVRAHVSHLCKTTGNFFFIPSSYTLTRVSRFSFLLFNHFTDGRTPWTSDQPVARPLSKHRTTQTQINAHKTSMPCVGFEHTITASERAKTVHALDRSATVTDRQKFTFVLFLRY